MQMAAAGEVLVCGPLYERIRHLVPSGRVATRGDVTLRGKSESIPVFAVSAGAREQA
jgi:class 3 adenylate cyclase